MAVINVTFGYVGGKGGPTNHPPLLRDSVTETISSAVTTTQTSNSAGATGFGEGCAAVRVYSDIAVWVSRGKNPTAVNSGTSIYLPAGAVEFFYVDIGDKLAFLAA